MKKLITTSTRTSISHNTSNSSRRHSADGTATAVHVEGGGTISSFRRGGAAAKKADVEELHDLRGVLARKDADLRYAAELGETMKYLNRKYY